MKVITMFYPSGIYCIINHSNNKIYIGQSVKTFSRLNTHKRQLKQGIHCNKQLQADYLSNPKWFEFKTLFNCPPDDLNYYESLMIKEAINQGFEVYNIIKNPYKELAVKIAENQQSYFEFMGCQPLEDPKLTILKNQLSKLK